MRDYLKAKLGATWVWIKAKAKAAWRSATAWVSAGAAAIWSYLIAVWNDPKALADTGISELVGQIDGKKALYLGLVIAILTFLARTRTLGR